MTDRNMLNSAVNADVANERQYRGSGIDAQGGMALMAIMMGVLGFALITFGG